MDDPHVKRRDGANQLVVIQVSQDLQRLFDYIEDADLWKWKLPDSKAFHAGHLLSAHTLVVNLRADLPT